MRQPFARDTKAAPAGVAVPRIPDFHFVEVVLVNFNFGVALGAGGHTLSFASLR